MVQQWAGDVSRNSFPSERFSPYRDDGRIPESMESYRRHRPLEIADALNAYCGIPGELYFLAVRGYDGNVTTFLSPGRLSHDDVEGSFFDTEKFKEISRPSEPNEVAMSSVPADAASNFYGPQVGIAERRRFPTSGGDSWDGMSASARKRQRNRPYSLEDDAEEIMSVRKTAGLRIGDSQAVYQFYEGRFKACQQYACKLLAKAWVKVLAPKKQSTHPYTGSDERAPDWWPKPWGNSKEERVRHKEPDHLYKRERVHLLIHILRLAMEPMDRKLPDLQKLNINVNKLEDATWEALSGWLAESDANSSKKPFINDIFLIAKKEEKFKDGQLEHDPTVFVAAMATKDSKGHASDNDEMRGAHDEEEAMSPSRATRARLSMRQDRSPLDAAGGHLTGHLPMRTAPFAPQQGQILDYMPASQPHQFENAAMPPSSQPAVNPSMSGVGMVHTAPAGDRRGSLFSNFSAAGGNQVFPGHWQHLSTPANPNQGYAYAAQQGQAEPQAYANTTTIPMPPAEHQGYLGNSFDGIARPNYDPSTMFRQTDMSSGANPPQNYPYSPSDGTDDRDSSHPLDKFPRHPTS